MKTALAAVAGLVTLPILTLAVAAGSASPTGADTTPTRPGGRVDARGTGFGAAVVTAAETQLGVPYSWAGGTYTGPSIGVCTSDAGFNDCHIVGFDCSGLARYAVYQASGGRIELDHFADTQTRGGTPVPLSALAPGDLISFTSPGSTVAHHVVIYAGSGRVVTATESGTLIRIQPLTDWRGELARAARYS